MLTFIDPGQIEKLRAAQALPSPRGVRLTIMLMCGQDNPDMTELMRLVQADPALSGRIIRIINVLNASRVRPIAAVTMESLLLIGLQAIRQLALALSLAEIETHFTCANFRLPAFWAHSFAMASGAQAITAHTRVAPLAEMFSTGLLAGIGKLTLAAAHPQAYSSLLVRKLDSPAQLAMEHSLFGFSHLSVAAALMQDWKIPDLFCEAVLYCETPSGSQVPAGSRQHEIIWTLNLAAVIAELGCGMAADTANAIGRVHTALGQLHLRWEDFCVFYTEAGRDWEEWSGLMGFGDEISWRALPPELTPGSQTSDAVFRPAAESVTGRHDAAV